MVNISLECVDCASDLKEGEMILREVLDGSTKGQRKGKGATYCELWVCSTCGRAVWLDFERGEPESSVSMQQQKRRQK